MNLKGDAYEEEVLAVIEEIEQEKRAMRMEPSYALDVEVRQRMPGKDRETREALRRLYKRRQIAAGRTVNNIWIKTRDQDVEKQREHETDEAGGDSRARAALRGGADDV